MINCLHNINGIHQNNYYLILYFVKIIYKNKNNSFPIYVEIYYCDICSKLSDHLKNKSLRIYNFIIIKKSGIGIYKL